MSKDEYAKRGYDISIVTPECHSRYTKHLELVDRLDNEIEHTCVMLDLC